MDDKYGTLWSREELILAFDLYCRIPFRKTKASTPEVQELATLIGRTPSSIARKLGNFGSLDPRLAKQDIRGLAHFSKLDQDVWDDFHANWEDLVLLASKLRVQYQNKLSVLPSIDDVLSRLDQPTERVALREERIGQSFFRASVLSGYDFTCCITGLDVPECLVASHIIPWKSDKQNRLDPRNGLALSATFDRLFDRGLITVTSDWKVVVSSTILHRDSESVRRQLLLYHGATVREPSRFVPMTDHLHWHTRNVFIP